MGYNSVSGEKSQGCLFHFITSLYTKQKISEGKASVSSTGLLYHPTLGNSRSDSLGSHWKKRDSISSLHRKEIKIGKPWVILCGSF